MSTTPDTALLRYGHLHIEYDERVLRPRPWTARQARWGAELLGHVPAGPVLELCCGAGHIGLLAVAASQRRLVAVDVSPAACELAARNAARAAMASRVEVREGDVLGAVAPDERFALVLADPPYLPTPETARYPEDPITAIDGGREGLDLVWPCLETVRRHLLPGGQALLQLRSADQVRRVSDRLAEQGELAVLEHRSWSRGTVARIAAR